METDDDHATMRESFSLVQDILFMENTDIFFDHLKESMVEKLWKAFQFGLFFDNVIWRELLVSFVVYNIIFFRQFVARTVNFMFVYISINVYVFDLATSKKKAKKE